MAQWLRFMYNHPERFAIDSLCQDLIRPECPMPSLHVKSVWGIYKVLLCLHYTYQKFMQVNRSLIYPKANDLECCLHVYYDFTIFCQNLMRCNRSRPFPHLKIYPCPVYRFTMDSSYVWKSNERGPINVSFPRVKFRSVIYIDSTSFQFVCLLMA